jgi:hypothetical protein
MSSAWSLIQLYPALGKLASDVSHLWLGKDGEARERVLQHKIDDLLTLLRAQERRTGVLTVEVATQTDSTSH